MALKEHNDNPLILALPERLEAKRLKQLLHKVPKLIPSAEFSTDDRIRLVKRLRKAVVPTRYYLDFYFAMYDLLIEGYEDRNPTLPNVIQWTYDIANPDVSVEELKLNDQITLDDTDTTSSHLFLSGLSGGGKTKLKKTLMSVCFPQVIFHTKDDFDELQIVHLNVEMPDDGTRSTFLKNIAQEFDETLKEIENTNYLSQMTKANGENLTIGAMTSIVKNLCLKYHVGVISVDEFQHLNVVNPTDFNLMLQLFDTMSNVYKVPFIKIGTPDALSKIKKFRNARRAGEVIEILPYNKAPDQSSDNKEKSNLGKDWKWMITTVFDFQVVNQPIKYSERVDQELHKLSCGLPYVLFTLWQETQIQAIRNKSEKITLQLLNIVYKKRFKLILPALNAIRGKTKSRASDLLMIDQLIEKGKNSPALKHLERYVNNENFTGVAAVDLLAAVNELDFKSVLKDEEVEQINKIKTVLEKRSQAIKKGQTINHE